MQAVDEQGLLAYKTSTPCDSLGIEGVATIIALLYSGTTWFCERINVQVVERAEAWIRPMDFAWGATGPRNKMGSACRWCR